MVNRQAEIVSRQLELRSQALLRSTSPIYAQSADGKVESVGTGLFLRFAGRHFVVSAGHVLQLLRHERLLIGGERLIPLKGRFFTSPSADVDLGFFPLSEEQTKQLDGARFLTTDDIDLEARPYLRRYYLVGFLAQDNAPECLVQEVASAAVCYLVAPASTGKYGRLGLSRRQHWLYAFDRRALYAGEAAAETEPVPEGLSGSSVWQFRSLPAHDKLVAIVIEHSETHRVLVGARLTPLLGSLAAYSADEIR